MRKQAGFTLIELVAVMVILAILAVAAVPQFVDLRVDAANAAADGVGGAITSGTTLNYARGAANGSASTVTGCDSTQLGALMVGGIPSGYTLGGTAGGLASGATRTCTLTRSPGSARNFTIIGCANATCS